MRKFKYFEWWLMVCFYVEQISFVHLCFQIFILPICQENNKNTEEIWDFSKVYKLGIRIHSLASHSSLKPHFFGRSRCCSWLDLLQHAAKTRALQFSFNRLCFMYRIYISAQLNVWKTAGDAADNELWLGSFLNEAFCFEQTYYAASSLCKIIIS